MTEGTDALYEKALELSVNALTTSWSWGGL